MGLAPSSFLRGGSTATRRQQLADLLEFWGLGAVAREPAESIAHGYQRLLEIAVAFARSPGSCCSTSDRGPLRRRSRDGGAAPWRDRPRRDVVLIDDDMDVVFSLADRIAVLNYGEILADGDPATVRNDPRVQDIYLGGE